MTPDDPRHGTEAGSEQHYRDGDARPCTACYEAKLLAARRRSKRKAMGHRYRLPLGDLQLVVARWSAAGASLDDIGRHVGVTSSQAHRLVHATPDTMVLTRTWNRLRTAVTAGSPVTPAGITRRIQALMWMGYSAAAIADAAGCHVETINSVRDAPRVYVMPAVRDGVVAAYDRLHMTFPVPAGQQHQAGITRSRNVARRRGWSPPLAWDDIDAPYQHHFPNVGNDIPEVDQVAVDRVVLHGDYQARCTPAERAEVVRRWVASGRSTSSLARLTGWNVGRYRPTVGDAFDATTAPHDERKAS